MTTAEHASAPGVAPPTSVPVARPTLSILIRVRGAMPSLRPAEQRVADAVLADPAKISESSITAVARQCQTSETTVLRFCRALGLAGYPELRIALARAAQSDVEGHVPSADQDELARVAAAGSSTPPVQKSPTISDVARLAGVS